MLSLDDAKNKMKEAISHLHEEAKRIRTGRANPAILDEITVEVYGQQMPIKHLANIIALDAQMLQISPFDPNNLTVISEAISSADLGLNPSDDGHVVRVALPPLTEERRKEMVKKLSEVVEKTKIALRNIRHDFLKHAKQQKNEGKMSEDEFKRQEKALVAVMEELNREIEAIFEAKKREIMTV